MKSITKTLNYILKKKKDSPTEQECSQPFILNRWLSMSDSSIAKIINSTTNRWITQTGICSNNSLKMSNFLKCIVPKINRKIEYIKKSEPSPKDEDLLETASAFQISTREMKIYNDVLEFINK